METLREAMIGIERRAHHLAGPLDADRHRGLANPGFGRQPDVTRAAIGEGDAKRDGHHRPAARFRRDQRADLPPGMPAGERDADARGR